MKGLQRRRIGNRFHSGNEESEKVLYIEVSRGRNGVRTLIRVFKVMREVEEQEQSGTKKIRQRGMLGTSFLSESFAVCHVKEKPRGANLVRIAGTHGPLS